MESGKHIVSYTDGPVKYMLYPAVVFLVIGMSMGVFLSANAFVFSDYFSGEYVHFGRLRPVHVGHVTLLWLMSANAGLLYYLVQRLCGISLWSVRLAQYTSILWWFSLVIGIYSFPFGTNYGWEYAELPTWVGVFPTKALFTLAWVLFATNILMTISQRRHEKMYVSLWYTMGNMVWTAITFIIGNFMLEYLPGGISRVNANFFYVHNLVGLIFTPAGLAIAYYFLPKLANTPIYSHRLSMIGFWTIAFTYAWIGAHHIIHGPMSQWLQTVSIIFSIWLFIPVWTVVVNYLATMRNEWHQYTQSAPIRFLMLGTVYYLLTCIQGPLQALRNVNEITSKTDWIIGHAHMALYGTFTFFAFAGIYFVVPVITKKPLWSNRLADWHFFLNLAGSLLMFWALFIGGVIQGWTWSGWANGTTYAEFHQVLAKIPFLETVVLSKPWWIFRFLSGVIILLGNVLFMVNVFNTVILQPESAENLAKKVIPVV